MKHHYTKFVGFFVIASIVFSACGGAPAPGSETCEGGDRKVCVTVTLAQPIHFNEPVAVPIIVRTKEDVPGLIITLSTSDLNGAVIEGPREWTVDSKANQPIQVTGTIRFTEEGYFTIVVRAGIPGMIATASEAVQITYAGGTADPTLPTGTPLAATYVPSPEATAGTPSPTPPFIPADRLLPPLLAEQVLSQCGWSAGSTPLTDWIGAKVYVQIDAPVPVNSPVPIVVEFEFEKSNKKQLNAAQVKLGLCLTDPGIQVVGERAWTITAQAGMPVTRTTTLRFTQTGEFAIRAGAYDTASGRVISGGQRTWAVTENSGLRNTSTAGALSAAQSASGWSTIITQTFESAWPTTGWTVSDLSNDGYDRKWDDDNYRPHAGYWAAWPARGGTHGRDPVAGNDDYFNNMNTRMIYGPFDLSDATVAETSFWLWRQIQTCCDYLAFEVSGDGVAFQEAARWTGTAGWEQKTISLNRYGGDSSVWVAWRFYSNASVVHDGPWVDDVLIRKYVPGRITSISGSFRFYDRLDQLTPARNALVQLYDADPQGGGDDYLGAGTVITDGSFTIALAAPIINWDTDDLSPDPYARRLDLYVVWRTDDRPTAGVQVTDGLNTSYSWGSATRTDVPDGAVTFNNLIPDGGTHERAMWIFQDAVRAWRYINNNTGINPGSATLRWEFNRNSWTPCTSSCFWPYPAVNGVFIADQSAVSADVVVHELGHQYMYNAMGFWHWSNWGDYLSCFDHNLFSQETQLCAWSEGWSDFLALAVNGDKCFDFEMGPCTGTKDVDYVDLEIPPTTWAGAPTPQGDTVEGRVAGALYDLLDTTNDGYDLTSFGFSPTWAIVRNAPHETKFADFWNSWKANGNNQHLAVQAIYQNTIDYDTAPTIANVPDIVVLQGFTRDNAIDLWAYSSDPESFDWELTYQITSISDIRCGVTLDSAANVDIAPQAGWLGACNVTVRVSDNIKNASDTFRVSVEPVRGRAYLPIIMKGDGATGPGPLSADGGAPPLPSANPTLQGYPAPVEQLPLPMTGATPNPVSYPAPPAP